MTDTVIEAKASATFDVAIPQSRGDDLPAAIADTLDLGPLDSTSTIRGLDDYDIDGVAGYGGSLLRVTITTDHCTIHIQDEGHFDYCSTDDEREALIRTALSAKALRVESFDCREWYRVATW